MIVVRFFPPFLRKGKTGQSPNYRTKQQVPIVAYTNLDKQKARRKLRREVRKSLEQCLQCKQPTGGLTHCPRCQGRRTTDSRSRGTLEALHSLRRQMQDMAVGTHDRRQGGMQQLALRWALVQHRERHAL